MRVMMLAWAVVCLAAPLRAEPLNVARVSADAKWMVHIDVDAVKQAEIVRWIWKQVQADPEAKKGLADVERLGRMVGVDLAKDIHGITIYGDRYTEQGGVVVLQAKVDQQRLKTFLSSRPGYASSRHGEHTVLQWTEKPNTREQHTVTGCFHGPGLIVFGPDAAAVRKALDVLDETEPSLSKGDALCTPAPPPGTVIHAAAQGLPDVELPFKSPLVQRSQRLSMAVGEHEGETFAEATLVTDDAEVADQVHTVAVGLMAMARLNAGQDEQAKRLLKAVEVAKEDNTVSVRCRGSTADILKLIAEAWAKQQRSKQTD